VNVVRWCAPSPFPPKNKLLTLSKRIATINGSPWQYPTTGSYLTRVKNPIPIKRKMNTIQRIGFQNVEEIFLSDALTISEKIVMRKSPKVYSM